VNQGQILPAKVIDTKSEHFELLYYISVLSLEQNKGIGWCIHISNIWYPLNNGLIGKHVLYYEVHNENYTF
jgi:hypothetical protein